MTQHAPEKLFCYRSKILPGKSDVVRQCWKNRHAYKSDRAFWSHLGVAGLESWLQCTPEGDYMICCLKGESLQKVFKAFREQIASGNEAAVELQHFYQEVLGKDYGLPEAEPCVECLQDVSLPAKGEKVIKRGFFFPLLPSKEAAHRQFRRELLNEKRAMHEAFMKTFGLLRVAVWLQNDEFGKSLVVYTERDQDVAPVAKERLKRGEACPAWRTIASVLMDHTGLAYNDLSPTLEFG